MQGFTGYPNLAVPNSLTGSGAPQIVPQFIGQQYIDINSGNIYISVGTNGVYNWGFVGKGSLVEFTKDTIPGLVTWYDASDNLFPKTNESTLTGWNDKGSNLNHLVNIQGTPKYYENIQNGLSAAYFNGSSAIRGSDIADAAQPQTHFLVFKPTAWSTDTYQAIIDMYNGTAFIGKNTGTTAIRIAAGIGLNGATVTNDITTITTAVFNGTSSSTALNSDAETIGSAGTSSNSNNPGIGSVNNNTLFYTGYVMEWLIYNGVLSQSNKNIVKSYLNNKWAVY